MIPMSVGKTDVVARNVRVAATEEGVVVSLDIDVNTNAYTAFAEARSKIMIYICDSVSNKKFKCKLIKDWGVWENTQILSFYHAFENDAIRTTLTIVLPNTIIRISLKGVEGICTHPHRCPQSMLRSGESP